ncbi:hypothetical protein ACFLVN_04190 [Chloroflexota bacterium]
MTMKLFLPRLIITTVVSCLLLLILLPSPVMAYAYPVPVTVGGEVYPVDKAAILAPWIALAVVIVAGGIYLVRRRAFSSK